MKNKIMENLKEFIGDETKISRKIQLKLNHLENSNELALKYKEDLNNTFLNSSFFKKLSYANIIFLLLHFVGIIKTPSFLPSLSLIYLSLFVSLILVLYYVIVFGIMKKQTEIYEYDSNLLRKKLNEQLKEEEGRVQHKK